MTVYRGVPRPPVNRELIRVRWYREIARRRWREERRELARRGSQVAYLRHLGFHD